MYKINGHYIYLTDKQYQYIFDKVAGHEDAWWRVSSSIIGHKENIEKHKRIKRYLENNFNEEYYIFDFYGEDARNNIESILGCYDELSNAIDIFDMHKPDFEEMMGLPKKHDIENIRIKIYEKVFFSWIFGRKDTGSSITINVKNVERIYGELTNFVVEGKKFNIRFTIDNVTVIYK